MLPVAVAGSSSDDFAIPVRYVLPLLSMKSFYLYVAWLRGHIVKVTHQRAAHIFPL